MIDILSNIYFSNLVYFFLFPFFFACSMYGWSYILFLNTLSKYISLNIVIGMGITLFIGGILNIFKFANQNVIDVIFLIGLILFIIKIFTIRKDFLFIQSLRNIKKNYFIILIPITLLIIEITSSIKPDAYNYHDDYQTYFIHPIKMLETGSMFGSTLSIIGSLTLGGQAFFQSFYISWLGLKSINIFDSVFCLSVCIFIILELAIKEKKIIFGVLIASLIILINPQFVNISSIYSAILIMISSIIFTNEILKDYQNNNQIKNSLGVSLCFASLIVLKTTYGIFPIIFFILLIFYLFFFNTLNKKLLYPLLITPLLSLIFASPWIFFYIKNYININQSTNEPIILSQDLFYKNFPNLFSTKELDYGSAQIEFTMFSIMSIFVITLMIFLFKNKKIEINKSNLCTFIVGNVSLLSCFIIYFLLILLATISFFQLSTSTRYSIPFITATFPLGLFLLYSLIPESLKYLKFIFCTIIIIFSATFFPQYLKSVNQSYNCGSQLSFTSFACSKNYIDYNKDVLNPGKKTLVRNWQEFIPKDQSVMVWINTPFYLDFTRNEIIEIDSGGLNNSWAVFPSSKYMIWEYAGYATKSINELQKHAEFSPYLDRKVAIRTLLYIQKIDKMFKTRKIEIIKDDGLAMILKFK